MTRPVASGSAFLRRRRGLRWRQRRGAQCACAGLRVGGSTSRSPPSLRLRVGADNLVAAPGWRWIELGELRAESVRSAGDRTFAMPGMVLFGRRWAIASDDLVFPGFFELVVRVLW
ncbi:Diacylglycerol lipase-beta [Plecturocebus cupreus]